MKCCICKSIQNIHFEGDSSDQNDPFSIKSVVPFLVFGKRRDKINVYLVVLSKKHIKTENNSLCKTFLCQNARIQGMPLEDLNQI